MPSNFENPYDQLCHDMVSVMCSALQYMKNAVDYSDLPITAVTVKTVHDDMAKLIQRYHQLRERSTVAPSITAPSGYGKIIGATIGDPVGEDSEDMP